MSFRARVIALALTLGTCASGIIALFWYQEMRYSVPTPVPENYRSIAIGAKVSLSPSLPVGKSYFLHFYNPDCPCSRFNVSHLRSLIGNYKDSIEIVVIVDSEAASIKARETFSDVIVTIDDNRKIAQSCGVYSTPQAAIIDNTGSLYFRGNYNASRFCTSRATNFAELSLIALLNNSAPPNFGLVATQSYGCELDDASASIAIF
jgi:hypothetical protein